MKRWMWSLRKWIFIVGRDWVEGNWLSMGRLMDIDTALSCKVSAKGNRIFNDRISEGSIFTLGALDIWLVNCEKWMPTL
jgi:hypothetical protein